MNTACLGKLMESPESLMRLASDGDAVCQQFPVLLAPAKRGAGRHCAPVSNLQITAMPIGSGLTPDAAPNPSAVYFVWAREESSGFLEAVRRDVPSPSYPRQRTHPNSTLRRGAASLGLALSCH